MLSLRLLTGHLEEGVPTWRVRRRRAAPHRPRRTGRACEPTLGCQFSSALLLCVITSLAAAWCCHHLPQDRIPWVPMLTPEELARAIDYYGSGVRLRSVAAKLVAGQPVTVSRARWHGGQACCAQGPEELPCAPTPGTCWLPLVCVQVALLGGSITVGLGATDPSRGYAALFGDLLNATFPHRLAAPPPGPGAGSHATLRPVLSTRREPCPAVLPAGTTPYSTGASAPARAAYLRRAWSAWCRPTPTWWCVHVPHGRLQELVERLRA